jgi:hypothetical protein
MHILRKDTKNNRVYVTISGVISFEEAEEIKEKMQKETEEIEPGFDVVNNISKYIQGEERAGGVLQEVVNHLVSKGVNRIIRVVGTSKTGLMQFAKFTQEIKGLNVHYFPTMEEAEEFLKQE